MIENGFNELTGAPTYAFEVKKDNKDKIFQLIQEATHKKWLMTAGTYQDIATQGLVPRHAYSIISSAIVEDNAGALCNLVKLRNPHGKSKWDGDWCAASTKWTLDIK